MKRFSIIFVFAVAACFFLGQAMQAAPSIAFDLPGLPPLPGLPKPPIPLPKIPTPQLPHLPDLPKLNPKANAQEQIKHLQDINSKAHNHIKQLTVHSNQGNQAVSTLQKQLEQARKEAHDAHMEAHTARREARLIHNALDSAVQSLKGSTDPQVQQVYKALDSAMRALHHKPQLQIQKLK